MLEANGSAGEAVMEEMNLTDVWEVLRKENATVVFFKGQPFPIIKLEEKKQKAVASELFLQPSVGDLSDPQIIGALGSLWSLWRAASSTSRSLRPGSAHAEHQISLLLPSSSTAV